MENTGLGTKVPVGSHSVVFVKLNPELFIQNLVFEKLVQFDEYKKLFYQRGKCIKSLGEASIGRLLGSMRHVFSNHYVDIISGIIFCN